MTGELLKGLALQALNMAKTDYELSGGKFICVLAAWHEGGMIHRMTKVEALIIRGFGENWLNSGAKKDAAFGVIRTAVDAMPPDALIFVTATNMFKPTAAFDALPAEEQRRLCGTGHDAHHQAVKEGLFTIVDSFTACAQSPELVCICVQEINRGRFVGKPQISEGLQSEFGGRLKMFGEEKITAG